MKKFLAISAIAAALLLTGCSQVGAAATIGDTKITQAVVQGSIDSILAERGKIDISQMELQTGADLNLSQLRFQVLTVLIREVGKDFKIEASKAEIDTRRAGIVEQVGGEAELPKALVGAGIAPQNLDLYLEAVIVSGKISDAIVATGVTQEALGAEITRIVAAKAAQLKVDVNPRYGKWDPINADVVAVDSAGDAVKSTTP
ncbi:MAG: hypothetical protein F2888_03870 [Actinobacteria bacterium]|uniref:Unannotated protein n=1 Tax=freshwater metagenome TaxID=449393 RepID=A0A6J7PAU5_9ZZZZ|nr:hypothetical protein [Actinomycetota bacterium]